MYMHFVLDNEELFEKYNLKNEYYMTKKEFDEINKSVKFSFFQRDENDEYMIYLSDIKNIEINGREKIGEYLYFGSLFEDDFIKIQFEEETSFDIMHNIDIYYILDERQNEYEKRIINSENSLEEIKKILRELAVEELENRKNKIVEEITKFQKNINEEFWLELEK